jgi:hypothetical protein
MAGQTQPIAISLESIKQKYARRLGALAARDLHEMLGLLSSVRHMEKMIGRTVRSFVVDGFDVTPLGSPGMNVTIGTGIGFALASGASDYLNTSSLIVEDATGTMINKRTISSPSAAIANNPSGGIRYDLIELAPTASPATVGVDEQSTADLYVAATNTFQPNPSGLTPTMTHGEPDIIVTTGAANGPPPAATAGRLPIAVIRVLPSATQINAQDIYDIRTFLADYAGQGPSAPKTRIDTSEITLDVAAGTTTATAQNFSLWSTGICGGIPFGIEMPQTLDLQYGTTPWGQFMDSTTQARITALTTTPWLYIYMVSADDLGYRYSRSSITDVSFGAAFSHCGAICISHIPPSLTNGSLAPSAALHLSGGMGQGTVTPGFAGRAVCVGVIPFDSTNKKFSASLRASKGAARLYVDAGNTIYPATTLQIAQGSTTLGTEATSSNVAYRTAQADITAPGTGAGANPYGPVALDLVVIVSFSACPTGGYQRVLNVRSGTAAEAAASKAPADHAFGTIGITTTGNDSHVLDVRGFPTARTPAVRGTTPTGLNVLSSVMFPTGSATTGYNPFTQLAATITGYTWPHGPVNAN